MGAERLSRLHPPETKRGAPDCFSFSFAVKMFLDKLKFALAETIHEELTARLDRASLQARKAAEGVCPVSRSRTARLRGCARQRFSASVTAC